MSEWIRTAKVGDKVVAVGGGNNEGVFTPAWQDRNGVQRAKKGCVYTIKSIHDWGGDRILINFMELDNSHLIAMMGGKIEPGWHYRNFRPVDPRNTDISIFTDMLKPVGKPVKELA